MCINPPGVSWSHPSRLTLRNGLPGRFCGGSGCVKPLPVQAAGEVEQNSPINLVNVHGRSPLHPCLRVNYPCENLHAICAHAPEAATHLSGSYGTGVWTQAERAKPEPAKWLSPNAKPGARPRKYTPQPLSDTGRWLSRNTEYLRKQPQLQFPNNG
jgi:hypothetical protein